MPPPRARYYLALCASVGDTDEVLWTGLTGDLARLAVEFAEAEERGGVDVCAEEVVRG